MESSLEHKRRRTCADREVIFRQGDTATEMYIIRSGKVRIFRVQDGHETELATLGPDDFFGEMALFDSRPRSASAQAVGDTELRVIDRSSYDLMSCDPVLRHLLATLAERLRTMDDAFEKLNIEADSRREFMSSKLTRSGWLT